MFKHFKDYDWNNGRPTGLDIVDPAAAPLSYKIVSDPYFKWITIEKYHYAAFKETVYDSALLNFKKLTEVDQTAWRREVLSEEGQRINTLLRNQDDRAILFETLHFERERCRQCVTTSIHGMLLCRHRMYYRSFDDPFDGVVLYDRESKPVLTKLYEYDASTGEFTTLIKESWGQVQ